LFPTVVLLSMRCTITGNNGWRETLTRTGSAGDTGEERGLFTFEGICIRRVVVTVGFGDMDVETTDPGADGAALVTNGDPIDTAIDEPGEDVIRDLETDMNGAGPPGGNGDETYPCVGDDAYPCVGDDAGKYALVGPRRTGMWPGVAGKLAESKLGEPRIAVGAGDMGIEPLELNGDIAGELDGETPSCIVPGGGGIARNDIALDIPGELDGETPSAFCLLGTGYIAMPEEASKFNWVFEDDTYLLCDTLPHEVA